MVTTFIFDVDDTLYDQLEPFRRAFQKHFSQFEDEVKIEELYKLSRKYSDEEALQFQLDYETFQNEIKLIEEFPQIFELLLQRGTKIGIITNGANDNQLRKINQLGLGKWIAPENILVSEGAGVSKPSKEVFEAMERRMGFSKNDVYYIGDNFDNDVIGTTAAGWNTIWVNSRNHKAMGKDVSATYVVETPKELLGLVDGHLREECRTLR